MTPKNKTRSRARAKGKASRKSQSNSNRRFLHCVPSLRERTPVEMTSSKAKAKENSKPSKKPGAMAGLLHF
jgi:hypothetical protein